VADIDEEIRNSQIGKRREEAQEIIIQKKSVLNLNLPAMEAPPSARRQHLESIKEHNDRVIAEYEPKLKMWWIKYYLFCFLLLCVSIAIGAKLAGVW
jgi:predicted component of type VI protein secretion system